MSWIHKDEINRIRSTLPPGNVADSRGGSTNAADRGGSAAAKKTGSAAAAEASTKLYLHVDMDAFFASVEVRDNPALQGHPVAVGGSADGRKGIITAANYPARKFGIKAGMAAFEAKRRCPKIIFVKLDPRKYTYASAQIMDLLEEFSPDIRILSVDEASMEISGVMRRFGTPENVGRAVKDAIRQRCNLPSTVGIASNRLVAKVVADTSKPDGLRFIHPGDEATYLAPLPVSKMCGIGPATEAALNKLGLITLGQLAGASDELMKLRFGVMGPWLAQMARGEYAGRMMIDDERGTAEKSMGHERTFGEPVNDRAQLRGWVVALAEMAARRVRSGHMVGRVLTMKLRYSDFETLHHQGVLPEPTDDEEMLILHGWKLLDQCWEINRPVRLLGMSVGMLQSKCELNPQMNLFTGKQLLRRESLYKAVDSLKDRYGEKILLRAMGSGQRTGIVPPERLVSR